MISVIIPLFNKESFIAKAIESVLNQTYSKYELLVINDESTDDSMRVVIELDDKRIRVITIDNSGVSVARNIGIQNAKYPWIAFLDADDWWDTSFLEEVAGAIITYPAHHIFATGRNRVFRNEIERYSNEYLPKDGETKAISYFKVISKYLPLVNSSNVVIRRTLFDSNGFFKVGQKKHEDHDLWIRLATDNEIVFINKPMSFYRKTEENSGSTKHYGAKDFSMYLMTLLEVRENLSASEKQDFHHYYNRFVLLTYIKYYAAYKKEEEQQVFSLASRLVTGNNLKLLKLLKRFPYKNTYPFFKIFKK